LGAWIACRRRGIALPPFADAVAPGIAFAQAIGRWGNWFNQELYGRATDLPWALEIDNARDTGTFHPTFLYESLWCLGLGLLVIWADRRFRLGHGRAFALYVAGYTAGRFWIEYLRIDEAHEFLGLRLNNWTALVVFLLAVAWFVLSARLRPGREEVVEPDRDGGTTDGTDATGNAAGAAGSDGSGEPAESVGATETTGRTGKTGERSTAAKRAGTVTGAAAATDGVGAPVAGEGSGRGASAGEPADLDPPAAPGERD
ncbi:prolipoprotein diacylglyceryl transferase, partial [Streptomyces alkaliphilus]|uniref:prolipoprotein diacylglyceryl transferase n=1 Tax=Streptomyces alkaliphilus TaxID=1472722 RepID=UPI00117DD6AF